MVANDNEVQLCHEKCTVFEAPSYEPSMEDKRANCNWMHLSPEPA